MMKIGCDPEFIPITSLKIKMDPYNVAREGGWGNVDIDDECEYDCEKNIKEGNIGSDAGGYGVGIGELRPKPGTPKQVVDNLRKMMRYLQDNKKLVDIIAGGGNDFNSSIGGHIHFDVKLPNTGSDLDTTNTEWDEIDAAEQHLIYALDYFIGRPLTDKSGGERDRGSDYGLMGDVRTAYHGNRMGFEYRTPPSWLTSPELAESVLWTAWAVVALYKKNRSFWCDKTAAFEAKGRRGPSGHNTDSVHYFRIQKLDLKKLKMLKAICPARGKKMIDVYHKLIKNKKLDLAQEGAITNWTGKKVLV